MNVIKDHFQNSTMRQLDFAPDRLLRIVFRRGGEFQRVRVIRHIGLKRSDNWRGSLCDALVDRSPAVRRNAAWALGRIGVHSDVSRLLAQAERERCDTVRLHLALAAVRCGGASSDGWGVLEKQAERKIRCAYGERSTGAFAGWSMSTLQTAWSELVVDGFEQAHTRAHIAAKQDPEDRDAIVRLGLFASDDDTAVFESLWDTAGRRMRLSLCRAMGLNGNPTFFRQLVKCLEAVDVDPGHGFAMRREAAIALGRLGLVRAVKPLVRALETEAVEHEGRPGAGMGIQHAVRTHIIGALGELQGAPRVLCSYLGNTHGSAQGGFYLPAMDALWKYGDGEILRDMTNHSDIVAANALGVLRAIEGVDALAPWFGDERPLVAEVVAP